MNDDDDRIREIAEVQLSGEIELTNDTLPPSIAEALQLLPASSEVRDGSRSMRRAIAIVRQLGRTPTSLRVHPTHQAAAALVAAEEGVELELDPAMPPGGPAAVRVRWAGSELVELEPDPEDLEDGEPWRAK